MEASYESQNHDALDGIREEGDSPKQEGSHEQENVGIGDSDLESEIEGHGDEKQFKESFG